MVFDPWAGGSTDRSLQAEGYQPTSSSALWELRMYALWMSTANLKRSRLSVALLSVERLSLVCARNYS